MARLFDLRNDTRRRGLLRVRKTGAGLWPLAVMALGLLAVSIPQAEHAGVSSPRADLVGHVSHVRDGDTIEIGGTPVRFRDLNCAELGTGAGARARDEMIALVRNREVSCRLTGRRSYDRHIGDCRLRDGRDLGDAMRARGVCRGG